MRGRWLLFARIVWLALAILSLGLYAAGIPYTYADYKSVCTGAACVSPLTPEVLRGLHDLGFSAGFFAAYVLTLQTVAVLVFATVAAVIFWHRSEDRMALFGAFALLLFGGAALNSDVSGAAAAAYPPCGSQSIFSNTRGMFPTASSFSPFQPGGSCRAGRDGSRWSGRCCLCPTSSSRTRL